MARNIKIEIVGDASRFSQALQGAERSLASFGTAAAVGFAAVGTAAVGVGAGLFSIGSKFDDASNTIRRGTGATGEALAELEDSFNNVAGNVVGQGFGEVSTAIADLNTRLGLTGKPLEDMSAKFLDLSRVTRIDVATNVDNVTRTFGDWGIATEDQAESMDKLFRASQASGIGFDELSTSLVTAGAPLRNIGFSMDESTALLAVFNKTGVNTETVLAGVKAGVGKLAKAGEDVPATFKRVVDEITALGPGSEATGLAIELFGQRSGPDLADAIAGGKFALDDMLAAITDGTDTITSAAADTEKFGDKWQQVKNKVFIGLEPIASGLFDSISAGMDRLGPTIDTVTNSASMFFAALTSGATEDEGTPVESFALTLRETVLPIIGRVSAFVTESLVPAVREFGTFVVDEVLPRIVELASFLRENVLPVITSIATFIKDEVVPRFQSLAATIAESVQPTIEALSEYWTNALQPALTVVASFLRDVVAPAFLAVADVIIQHVVPFVLEKLLPTLLRIQTMILGTVVPALAAVVSFIADRVGPAIGDFIGWLTDVIGKAGEVASSITEKFDDIVSTVRGMPSRISSAASGMFNGIRDAFRSAINWIIDRWNGLSFTLPSVDFLGQTIGGGTVSTPRIDRFAAGTSFAPGGLAIVNERGAEMIELPRGSSVTPEHRSRMGSNAIEVYVMNPHATAQEIGAAVGWALRTGGGTI